MSLLNCRSLTVTLLLLVIGDSTTYGFSLHRGRDKSEDLSPVDLVADESTLLEVKNDLKRPNDIKSFEVIKDGGGNSEKNSATDKNKTGFDKSKSTDYVREAVTKLSDEKLNASKETSKATLMRGELVTRYNENFPFLSTITNTGTTPLEFTTSSNHRPFTLSSPKSSLASVVNPNIKLIGSNSSYKPNDFITVVTESHDSTTSDSFTNPFNISKDLIQDINELGSTVDTQVYTTDYGNDIANVSEVNIPTTIIDSYLTFSESKLPTTTSSTKRYMTLERKKSTTSEVTTNGNRENTSGINTTLESASVPATDQSKEASNENSYVNPGTRKISISVIDRTSAKPEIKIGMVSSMRAGYLDYSGKVTTQSTTTPKAQDRNTEKPMDKKTTSTVQSLGQLSEDVINEQLLKEEIIKDNAENEDRNHNFSPHYEGVRPLAEPARTTERTPVNATNQESVSESFNVQPILHVPIKNTVSPNNTPMKGMEEKPEIQPITHEPTKNTELYTVNPNYKPMKRLEVQPAKPFVRDPDDNSWRNESISSLGIVFKPKNASKSFTQVLKNKTETVLNSLGERDSKGGIPDLRERLEKIAEVRKSKKKRINKFGDTVYTDYEEKEISNEANKSRKTQKLGENENANIRINPQGTVGSNTGKQNSYNIAEYYDTTDEYDADYLTLTKVDIKKHPMPTKETYTDTPITFTSGYYFPDRRPTIQYFPPRVTPKINNHNIFHSKINSFTVKDPAGVVPLGTVPTVPHNQDAIKPNSFPRFNSDNYNKNAYLTDSGRIPQQHGEFDGSDGNFNRASYVVKHYGDFINEAARADDDRQGDYVVITEPPVHAVTVNELPKLTTQTQKQNLDNDYDYDAQFRKDLINRFVSNFNQNSERFKVDFPIIYNNSVVHKKLDENGNVVASSTAFMKSLYNDLTATKPSYALSNKPCYPHCENITVELSPAYELHYYVPDEEEKQPVESRPTPVPYRFRL